MKKFIILINIVLLGSSNVLAATEYEKEVPLDLVQYFLGNGQMGMRIYKDLPDGFPIGELPADVEVIGSLDMGNQQRVILRSTQNQMTFTSVLAKAVLAAGWQAIPRPRPRMPIPQRGFVSAGMDTPATSYCDDSRGNLNISNMASGQQGNSLMQLYYTRQMGVGNNCQQQISMMMRNQNNSLQENMPSLELPQSMNNKGAVLSSSGSNGSTNYFESRASLLVDMTVAKVFAEFAPQLKQQGWNVDVENTGKIAASGFWSKEIKDEEGNKIQLIAMLTILENQKGSFDLLLRVSQPGNNNNAMIMGVPSMTPFLSR